MEARAEYIEKRKIYREEWYVRLANRLGRHLENKARAKVLRIQLMKDVMPDAKMISNYSEGGGKSHEEISPKEMELVQLEKEISEVEAALGGLRETPKVIIILRYIEGVRDWHIYEIKKPMSKTAYYDTKNQAMEQLFRALN